MIIAVLLASALLQADAALQAARRAEQAGDLASAERAYETAVAAEPSAETWQRLGLVRHLQNKFASAIPALQKAVAADPNLWGAHLFLGIDYYRTNRFQEALSSLRKADALTHNNEIDFWIGATQLALKDYLAGFRILEQLRARDPKNVEVLRLLAENYARYSADLWNDVAEHEPDSAAGLEVHGLALESEGATDAALDAYLQSLGVDRQRPGVRTAIGRLLLSKGDARAALTYLEEELRSWPGEPQALYQAGAALAKLGRIDEARERLETAARWPQVAQDATTLLAAISGARR